MRPLYTEAKWPKIAAFDLEADEWVDVCLVCHVDEYGNRLSFPDIHSYVDWLFESFPGEIIFAHAGGHYDNRFIIADIHERGWSFKTAISGGTIVILTVNNGKRTIKFGDSYRLMPDSLKSIGKTVGLEKLEVNPTEIKHLPKKQVLEYCFRDCDIVVRGLQLMRQTLTAVGADFAFTLASIAARYNRRDPGIRWDEFVHKVNGKWEPRPETKLWDAGCYMGYFGGRCEMFKKGIINDRPIYWYDIRSSYPASMREGLPLYPKRNPDTGNNFFPPPRRLKNLRSFLQHCGLTECAVYYPDTHDTRISVLPEHEPETGRLVFKTSKEDKPEYWLRGTWTNIELLEALDHGAEIRYIVGQWRFESVPFMRKFVDKFYGLRQRAIDSNDAFGKYAFKILLNSSYGKFIETVHRKAYLSGHEIMAAVRNGAEVKDTPTMGVHCAVSEEVGPFRHTAVGAYITAYSRLRLFRKALEMHRKGATIYYCDTDSLLLDMPIDGVGPGIGEWEQVDVLQELELVLPKVYRAVSATGKKTVYKCKGCPIERQWEDDKKPAERWEAFKHFRNDEANEELIAILGKDGVTGFVQDVNAGTLKPRRRSAPCSACKKTGAVAGVKCPICDGKKHVHKPLVRSLRSEDKKRIWDGNDSRPINTQTKKRPEKRKTKGSTK